MEDTLIRLNFLNLIIDNKRFESLECGRRAVQRLITNGWNGGRLVSQRLRDLKVVERGRANGPSVAEDGFSLAIQVGELGRIRLRGEQRERCLASS